MITRENYEIWMLDYVEGKLNSAQRSLFLEFLAKNPDLKKQLDAFDNNPLEKPFETGNSSFNLKKKQSWLLEKYSEEELVFNVSENLLNTEELREWNELVKVNPNLLDKVIIEKKLVLKPVADELYDEKLLLRKSEGSYLITAQNCSTYFLLYADNKELALHKAIQTFIAANPQYKTEFELSQKLVLKANTSIVFEEKENLKKKERRVIGFYTWSSVAAAACLLLVAIFFYPGNEQPNESYAGVVDSVKTKTKWNNKNTNDSVPQELITNDNKSTNSNNVAINNTTRNEKNKTHNNKSIENNEQHNKKEIFSGNENMVKNDDKLKPENKPETIKNDSTKKSITPVEENKNESLASNTTANPKNDKGLNPLDAVAKVINNKYYEKETPKDKEASSFYAMKNVVNSASRGNADISKKEDSDYKEFGFKVGDFKFSRKKNKNKAKED